MEQWVLKKLLTQVNIGQYRPTFSVWVMTLPIAAFPSELQVEASVNKTVMVKVADSIVEYLGVVPRRSWHDICYRLAVEIQAIDAKNSVRRGSYSDVTHEAANLSPPTSLL